MKRIILSLSGIMLTIAANAQVSKLAEFENTYLKPLFPVVVGIAFLIGALTNIGKLWGENRDIKGFFINIFIYIGAVLLVAGLYTMVRSMSL